MQGLEDEHKAAGFIFLSLWMPDAGLQGWLELMHTVTNLLAQLGGLGSLGALSSSASCWTIPRLLCVLGQGHVWLYDEGCQTLPQVTRITKAGASSASETDTVPAQFQGCIRPWSSPFYICPSFLLAACPALGPL